jgi:toxin ParE1/3/4
MAAVRPNIIWSPEAEQDLLDIWDYLARGVSLDVADDQISDIDRACRPLHDHPLAGRSREELAPTLRSIVASPYVVFYRVKEDTVQIVRVLHGARDLDAIFADDIDDEATQ